MIPRTFSSLRHRNYRIYFAGQIVSLIGTWMQSAAQSWLVYELTGSKVMLGVVGAAGSLPQLFFSTYGGLLADRIPRRRILVATQAASAVLAFVLGAIALSGVMEVWHIVTLAVLLGVVNGFDMPARQSFVVDLVDRADLMNAIALNSSAFHGARIVGPAVAGLVMGVWGPGPCFLVNSLTYMAVIAALLSLRLAAAQAPGRRGGGATEGFRVVGRSPGLAALLLLTLVIGVFGWSYVVLLPVFARDVLEVGEEGYGLLMSATGLGSVGGALLVATIRDPARGRAMIAASISLFAPAVSAFASSRSFALSMAMLLVTGLGLTTFFATANTLIQTSVTDDVRGRVMGIYVLVFGAMLPLGATLSGGSAHFLGAPATVRLGAIVCAVACLAALGPLGRLRAVPGFGPPRKPG